MRGRNVDADTKAKAVGLALVTSGAEAARQMGLPERTVQQWVASPEFAALRATPREDVVDAMWVAAQEGVHALREGITNPKAYLRDKVAAFDSLMEKWALLRGEATSRTELKDITRDLDDHEAEIFGEVVRAELARRADEASEVAAVEGAAPS